MAKRGIDIAEHQGDIDLWALKDEIDFVIIRVGYGVSGYIDSMFERNTRLCEEVGLPYGFYWYSYALETEGAKKEAEHFLNAIKPFHPTYGCWFDMEDADGYKARYGMPSNEELQDMCYAFCEAVEKAGYYTGVYASESWFYDELAGDKLSRFDKWVAQWPTRGGEQTGLDTDPNKRSDVGLWQFTSKGYFEGYSGGLDTDYAYHEFPNPNGSNPTPAPEPEPAPTSPQGSTFDLALGVMNGEYGDGEARKQALGSRYDEVQDFINHIFTGDANALAQEVIDGKYGNGDQRKTLLGSRYDEVQDKVNEILNGGVPDISKGSRVRFTGTKSYSGLPLASWTHNDVFDVIEVSGDRVVIGKGTAVTAAVNIKDCQKV